MEAQWPRCTTYVEPFAGGAGVAMRLLYDEYVERVVINDLDAGLAAFWRSVFDHTDELATLIESADVTLDAWHHHRDVYVAATTRDIDDLSLGFSTFFLNRTNRSGILGARPIGGLNQSGRWKISARFNRSKLAARVRALGPYRRRVSVTEEDGVCLLERHLSKTTFTYADPPYLTQGADLYLDTFNWEHHVELAQLLAASRSPWMVTYDHDDRVHNLYQSQRLGSFSIAHTAATPHVGREYVVFSDSLRLAGMDAFETRRRFAWLVGP